MIPELSQIKLVIWDLDGTFWNGVLSEGEVTIPEENRALVKDMADTGVMCSICSKNDEAEVRKVLDNHGLADHFVFRSVNWSPKGERVRQIISEMNLRAENVLFLDDNALNLNEAKAACPALMTGGVDMLPALYAFFAGAEKTDTEHKRLHQYQMLEKKQAFKATVGNNEDFLLQCHIAVQIHGDCKKHIDRIAELIARTNQLNFTKKRITKQELIGLLDDPAVEKGYITVTDDFGEYGIVGFYAKQAGELIHFLFSCRILNMGVEQYVYHMLGRPEISVVPEVSSALDGDCPSWINHREAGSAQKKDDGGKKRLTGKILIKGPCDMEQMFSFIEPSPNIITEFTYVNDAGVSIEHYNHTTQIINTRVLSEKDKKRMCALPFCDKNMYSSTIFDEDVSVVMFSLFNDPHLGVYREKETGILMAFGEYLNDLTDESRWNDYISGKLFTAKHRFTEEELRSFKEQFEYQGRLTPEEVMKNLQWIFSELSDSTVLILCLGSEMNIEPEAYEGHESYLDRHLYHKELNDLVREWAKKNDRIYCVDVNDHISSRDDFLDTINHMKKSVYYGISLDFIRIVNNVSEKRITQATQITDEKQKHVGLLDHVKRRMRLILFHER